MFPWGKKLERFVLQQKAFLLCLLLEFNCTGSVKLLHLSVARGTKTEREVFNFYIFETDTRFSVYQFVGIQTYSVFRIVGSSLQFFSTFSIPATAAYLGRDERLFLGLVQRVEPRQGLEEAERFAVLIGPNKTCSNRG